jgi:hypothetical protein
MPRHEEKDNYGGDGRLSRLTEGDKAETARAPRVLVGHDLRLALSILGVDVLEALSVNVPAVKARGTEKGQGFVSFSIIG